MKLSRPLAVVDLEGTDKDASKSYIVEIGITILEVDGSRRRWHCRFRPPAPIPAEATAVHGITDADVADCPPFSEWATRILSGLNGKDLAVYNGWRYDLPLLDEELRRAGFRLNLDGVRVIDAYGIFAKKEPRTLADAVRKYCGREHEGAHGAAADAEATLDVLQGQLATYEDLAGMTLDDLAAFSRQSEHRMADLAGKLYYDQDGELRYAFGKHEDLLVADQPGYANWMLRCYDPPFPGSTCELLRKALGYPDDEEQALPEDVEPGDFDDHHGDQVEITAEGFEAIVQDGISNYIDSQGGTEGQWRPVVEGYLRPQYRIVG